MNRATEVSADGTHRAVTRAWVPEVPVAFEFNGLAYAVMMATPPIWQTSAPALR